MSQTLPQAALLRIAAFLVDALSAALLMVFLGAFISYALALTGGSGKAITLVWYAGGVVLITYVLFRDSGGRSPGKRLLGLRIITSKGKPCGVGRSLVRNLPLVVPGWNVLEALLLISDRRRTGDRLAATAVSEE